MILHVKKSVVAMLAGLLVAGAAHANWLTVTNLSLVNTDTNAGTTDVQFDMSWSNSWRSAWNDVSGMVTNWDAAWVFIKYRRGAEGPWLHAALAATGHTAGSGTPGTVDLGATGGTNVGAFIYRSANGYGPATFTAATLRWDFGTNGLSGTNDVDISVQAIEMVHVPAAAFYAGGIGSERDRFFNGANGSLPFHVQSEATLGVGTAATNIYYSNSGAGGDLGGPIPAVFPKGYAAFYCMKYEISQGQYTDFLNKLTSPQASARFPNQPGTARHTISFSGAGYSCTAPDRGCNFLSWADGVSYADWAGLRPMTELELEKAARGPMYPVADEFAWGSAWIVIQTNHLGSDGSGSETALPADANCNYGFGICRVGIFATTNSTRVSAGAGYYGTMDLTGNLYEQVVTAGNVEGRAFTALHGDGSLSMAGNANATNWPGPTAVGAGCRTGYPGSNTNAWRLAARDQAITPPVSRDATTGWRGVRTAP